MHKTDKPWGFEEVLVNNGRYVVKKIVVWGEHRLSLQFHETKLETLLIWSGKGVVVLGDERLKHEYDVKGWDPPMLIDISTAGTVHRVEAAQDTELYEVSTPELNDIVRLEDDYGRV